MSVLDYFLRHPNEVLELTLEHLWLVGLSTLLAVAAGLPLGVLLTRRPAWSRAVLEIGRAHV